MNGSYTISVLEAALGFGRARFAAAVSRSDQAFDRAMTDGEAGREGRLPANHPQPEPLKCDALSASLTNDGGVVTAVSAGANGEGDSEVPPTLEMSTKVLGNGTDSRGGVTHVPISHAAVTEMLGHQDSDVATEPETTDHRHQRSRACPDNRPRLGTDVTLELRHQPRHSRNRAEPRTSPRPPELRQGRGG